MQHVEVPLTVLAVSSLHYTRSLVKKFQLLIARLESPLTDARDGSSFRLARLLPVDGEIDWVNGSDASYYESIPGA